MSVLERHYTSLLAVNKGNHTSFTPRSGQAAYVGGISQAANRARSRLGLDDAQWRFCQLRRVRLLAEQANSSSGPSHASGGARETHPAPGPASVI